MIKKAGEEEIDGMFYTPSEVLRISKHCSGLGVTSPTPSRAAAGMRRAGTIVRAPLEARRERGEQTDGDMGGSDVGSTFRLA